MELLCLFHPEKKETGNSCSLFELKHFDTWMSIEKEHFDHDISLVMKCSELSNPIYRNNDSVNMMNFASFLSPAPQLNGASLSVSSRKKRDGKFLFGFWTKTFWYTDEIEKELFDHDISMVTKSSDLSNPIYRNNDSVNMINFASLFSLVKNLLNANGRKGKKWTP